jgi:DNA polymerase-3 subunit alpha
MDRMISISQQAHGAAQQFTMFDLPAFADTARLAADLPDVAEVPRKELLGWEKELIGAYISDHPLSRIWADLEGTITVLTGQIDETMNGQNVTVAGMVGHIRPIITKKGDPMAFVQLEDLQGTIELVVFPRTWEETRELWVPERVLVVRGRVSNRGREPSILVESATTEITTARPVGQESPPAPSPPPPPPAKARGPVHLHVTVRAGHDTETLVQRLGRVYDLLQGYRGEDRFSLYVENGGRNRMKIDFPNNTTRHCVELEQRLRQMLGAGTVRVDPES